MYVLEIHPFFLCKMSEVWRVYGTWGFGHTQMGVFLNQTHSVWEGSMKTMASCLHRQWRPFRNQESWFQMEKRHVFQRFEVTTCWTGKRLKRFLNNKLSQLGSQSASVIVAAFPAFQLSKKKKLDRHPSHQAMVFSDGRTRETRWAFGFVRYDHDAFHYWRHLRLRTWNRNSCASWWQMAGRLPWGWQGMARAFP